MTSRERFEEYIKSLPAFRDSLLWHEVMRNEHTPYLYVQSEWLTWQAAEAAAVRRCAELCKPNHPRPCDCTHCDCGNSGDKRDVDYWDAENADYLAIKAEFPEAFK